MFSDLFDWCAKDAWLAQVNDYAGGFLTASVRSKLAKSRPECWSDNFAWLPIEDGEERFASAFASYYRHIRAFHGCRPMNLGSYFSAGLHGQSAEAIENQFLELFHDVPRAKLDEVLVEFEDRRQSERGRFWVVLDESELVEDCGHYLIQGSEYLMALAATLCRVRPGEDYRLRLRSIGTPTIFELHIPTKLLPYHEVAALSRLVLSSWGEQQARRPLGVDRSPCLTVNRAVEARHLVRHVHPSKIRDPHFSRLIYLNERTTCPHCRSAEA
jgi:hypothetical protein